jgi:DNA primase
MAEIREVREIAGREVTISNPGKVYFPRTGHTKGDLITYYLRVSEGAIGGVSGRPMALKRFVNGAEGEAFFQKRAPANRPAWVETAHGRRGRRPGCGAAGVGGEPRLHRPQPPPGAGR